MNILCMLRAAAMEPVESAPAQPPAPPGCAWLTHRMLCRAAAALQECAEEAREGQEGGRGEGGQGGSKRREGR